MALGTGTVLMASPRECNPRFAKCATVVAMGIDKMYRDPDDATVVDPLPLRHFGWRDVFSFIARIDEEIRVARENNLHQASAELRNDSERDPAILKLLGMPAAEGDRRYAAPTWKNGCSESRPACVQRRRQRGEQSKAENVGDAGHSRASLETAELSYRFLDGFQFFNIGVHGVFLKIHFLGQLEDLTRGRAWHNDHTVGIGHDDVGSVD